MSAHGAILYNEFETFIFLNYCHISQWPMIQYPIRVNMHNVTLIIVDIDSI